MHVYGTSQRGKNFAALHRMLRANWYTVNLSCMVIKAVLCYVVSIFSKGALSQEHMEQMSPRSFYFLFPFLLFILTNFS